MEYQCRQIGTYCMWWETRGPDHPSEHRLSSEYLASACGASCGKDFIPCSRIGSVAVFSAAYRWQRKANLRGRCTARWFTTGIVQKYCRYFNQEGTIEQMRSFPVLKICGTSESSHHCPRNVRYYVITCHWFFKVMVESCNSSSNAGATITGLVNVTLIVGVPREGGFGCLTPEISKALQNRTKLNPIVKTVKN